MITILAVGKKHNRDLAVAIEGYQKRLRPPFNVKWVLIQNSSKSGHEACCDESERLLRHVGDDDVVILLDERGRQLSSSDFSQQLSQQSNSTIIIGGAYGVDDRVRRRANVELSLSKMVFPHQLVRLIIIEQIYRAQTIYYHHPYHHD